VAISREDENGQPPGGWLPQQKIGLEQAFDGFTRRAAFAGFAESEFGTLEPGRWADFLFIDRDIFALDDPRQVRGTQVLETWVAGRKAWERR
jgi:predicted amidohydrolase YtcJ